jgi:hypothetical protein
MLGCWEGRDEMVEVVKLDAEPWSQISQALAAQREPDVGFGSDTLVPPGTTSINISSIDLKLRESTMYMTSRCSAAAEKAEIRGQSEQRPSSKPKTMSAKSKSGGLPWFPSGFQVLQTWVSHVAK